MSDTRDSESIIQIPVDRIRPSAYQARKIFNEQAMKALAESLKHEGLIQPVVVRASGVDYELVSGERRLRAAKMIGWETIAARVISVVSEGEVAAKGLVENLQRKNLNPIEEADGFAELQRTDSRYWTQDRIGQVCGKDRTYVTRSLKLLTLPASILDKVRAAILSRNHAIELARLTDPTLQARVESEVESQGLTVAQTRKKVDGLIGTSPKRRSTMQTIERPAQENDPAATLPDPLSDVWNEIAAHPALGASDVTVHYRGDGRWTFDAPALGAAEDGMPSTGVNARATRNALVDWLTRLADALRSRG